jgi:hypothetical protein
MDCLLPEPETQAAVFGNGGYCPCIWHIQEGASDRKTTIGMFADNP